MRPADFDTVNTEFAKWPLVMPSDGVLYADPFSVPAVVQMSQKAFERSSLFGGLQASPGLAATTKLNSTNLAGFTSRGPTLDDRICSDGPDPDGTNNEEQVVLTNKKSYSANAFAQKSY